MAIEFGKDRAQDFAPANLMSFGKSFSRMGAQPLDMNEVWYDLDALKNYAKTNATAYVGMRLVHADSATGKITVYAIKNTAGDLLQIASADDIQAAIDAIPDVDLSEYAKSADVDKAIEEAIDEIVIPEDTNTTYGFAFDKTTQKITITPSEGKAVELDLSDFLIASDLPEDKNTEYHLEYSSEDKVIKLVAGADADKMSIDATPFIKDGMLSDVEYDAASNTLTFVWNTDAGLQADTVVLSDILDPYIAGDKIVIDGSKISHAKQTVSAGETGERTYVTNITYDDYGHITGFTTGKETVVNTDTNDTYLSGDGIEIRDEDELEHSVHIKLADGEKNLVVDQDGLATNFDLDDYVLESDAKGADGKGIRYISQEEINKLKALTIEGEDVTISGTVEASSVKNLYSAIEQIVTGVPGAEDFDADQEGVQAAFGIEKGAEVNKIDDVSDDFTISTARVLSLKDIQKSKVIGLEDALNQIDTSVQSLENIVNGYDVEGGSRVVGLVERVASLENDHVTVESFNAVVADLAKVKSDSESMMNDIAGLQDALSWKNIDEEATKI